MTPLVDVLIPSLNNLEQLHQCVASLHRTVARGLCHVTILNNGHPGSVRVGEGMTCVDLGTNHGWEGALQAGLARTRCPFVLFLNDDTYFPANDTAWLQRLLAPHAEADIAQTGPSSNVVMGQQNMFYGDNNVSRKEVTLLIGFCVLNKRAALEAIGGIDASLPGGDDFDLGIRFRAAGYRLLCCMDVFVFHHGFQTGQRTHGSYWNSQLMQERTNNALIRKHGMQAYHHCVSQSYTPLLSYGKSIEHQEDAEGHLCRQYAQGQDILDLGCGFRKTLPYAVGVDQTPAGEQNGTISQPSVADLTADVQEPLPVPESSQDTIIARHILEHLFDPLRAMRQWTQALKPGGRLLIAVPDNRYGNSILMNPEHIHAFTSESLNTLAESSGLHLLAHHDRYNGMSFLQVYEKPLVAVPIASPVSVEETAEMVAC